jgi:DNA-binding transcriptional MerR regulator
MSQVNLPPNPPVAGPRISGAGVNSSGNASGSGAPQIPPGGASGASGGVDYAALGIPSLAAPVLAGLSLEQLVEALGGEGRRLAVQQGLDAVKAKGEEIKELNDKKTAEIRKQIDTLKKKEKLSPFLKAMKWIGLALGAIGAAIAVGAAVITGNPLLIAGAAIGAAMLINSLVSTFSDGKYSLASGIAAAAEKLGASESVAQWIGFAVEMAVVVVGAGLSIVGAWKVAAGAAAKGAEAAAGAAKGGAQAAAGAVEGGAQAATGAVQAGAEAATGTAKVAVQVVTPAQKWISIATATTSILGGANSVASGSLAITSAKYDYDIALARAELKDLQASLQRIQTAMQTEEDFVEAVMEKTQDLLGKVKEIVQDNNTAQTAILGGSPAMA